MTDPYFSKIANGLMKAIATPTDELAAKYGEGNVMVKVKRNSDKLRDCDRHEFEVQSDWRTKSGPMTYQMVRCVRCDGEMKAGDVMTYLKGFANGAGLNYTEMANAVWPPGDGSAGA